MPNLVSSLLAHRRNYHGSGPANVNSHGVLIEHKLSVDGLSPFSNPETDIAEIDFADGSSWHKLGDLVKR